MNSQILKRANFSKNRTILSNRSHLGDLLYVLGL